MSRLLAALLLFSASPAFAGPSGVVTGLLTTGAGVLGGTAGAIGGGAAWMATDASLTEVDCTGVEDNCGLGPVFRGLFLGAPLGATLGGLGAAGLTHHLVSGREDGKVWAAGAGTAAGGILVGALGAELVREGQLGAGAVLYVTGATAAVVATPVVMGVVSGKHPRTVRAVARGPRLEEVGAMTVEGGGGLVLGGSF